MRRTVGREVESMLAGAILRGQLMRGDSVRLTGEGAKVSFRRLHAERVDEARP